VCWGNALGLERVRGHARVEAVGDVVELDRLGLGHGGRGLDEEQLAGRLGRLYTTTTAAR
jgi:hypothetical protein